MLITESYRELQKDLHARFDYGHGGDSKECEKLVRALANPGATVLDYGCGQGHLGRLLTDYDVEEYDPAIDGKDDEPASADVVVCADVLEHIEPELIWNVLIHLRALVRQHVVLVIATRPSGKVMADGRTAHLIVENADWWSARLSQVFDLVRFDDRSAEGRGLLAIGKPREAKSGELVPITRIRATTAVTDDARNENVRLNCAATDSRLEFDIPAHNRTAHLVCYGPSLRKTWPLLAIAKAKGEDVFTVSGAHKFLIDRGVAPFAHMDCDPREHKADMLGVPHTEVEYWLSSCVSPHYLKRLNGHSIKLWHSYNGKSSQAFIRSLEPDRHIIVGGGSIGLRAMSVLYCRGYRKFEIHGMDCSFDGDEHHAGEHPGKNNEASAVKCGGRWFRANAVMILYARYFRKQQIMMQGATLALHGDGLLQHMVKTGAQ